MTMIRPRSDVVYGICRGLPSGIFPCIPPIKEHRKEHNVLYIKYGHVHVYVCISITKMIQLKLKCFTTKQSNNAYFHFRL